jgi:hypothetical protein
VSFDLTGLPPTETEIAEFVADHSPKAHERVVDRLLASKAYGERWARHWLDLVGYAEQIGTEGKIFAEHAWRYRDYLVESFHQDKPFDRFSREQRAGDLLPATSPQERRENLIATGFIVLGDVYITDKTIPFAASSSTETPVLFGELAWDWTDHTVVSISGAMTRRKFSVSGGSTSVLEGNKIGKAVQLKKLEEEISGINLLIHNENIGLEQNQENLIQLRQSTGKSLIEHLQKEILQLRQEEAALQARKDQSLELIRNSAAKKEGIDLKIKQLSEVCEQARPAIDGLKLHVEQLQASLEKEQTQSRESNEASSKASGMFNQLNIEQIKLQNGLQGLRQTLEYLEKEESRIRNQQQQSEPGWSEC